jgi:hypothetical protein
MSDLNITVKDMTSLRMAQLMEYFEDYIYELDPGHISDEMDEAIRELRTALSEAEWEQR